MFLNNAQIIQGLNFTSSQVIMCDPHSNLQALAIKSQEVILTCISGLLIKKFAKYYLHTPDIAIKWLIIKYSNIFLIGILVSLKNYC